MPSIVPNFYFAKVASYVQLQVTHICIYSYVASPRIQFPPTPDPVIIIIIIIALQYTCMYN